MSTTNERADALGAGRLAVVAVLAPVLLGALAVTALLTGFALRAAFGLAESQAFLTVGWSLAGAAVVAITASIVGLLVTALRNRPQAVEDENPASEATLPPSGRSARRALDLASFVAGDRRAHLREEWSAVLAGDPENGIVLSSGRRMNYAIGFVCAALRMRLRDLAAPLWVPVDWLLTAESRTHGFMALGVGAQALYIQHEDGLHTLVTEGWGWCAACGITLRLFVGWLRRVRGIELASRRTDSGEQ
ncbi:hypothetical protein ABZT26_25545 [Streptomyces sp. NPDC005395]|uniref:hypothetical protein n=1 Tax=Streptomyces sp. NPDC005395 TaxID=3157042 RepID=UPI0033ACFF2F